MVDFLDEILGSEEDEEDAGDKLNTTDDIKTLREEIDELNKEKAGLLKGVKAERAKRQEISGKLSQLTDTVNGLLSNRDAAAQQAVDNAAGANKKEGLPVTWTEDGEGFVDPNGIDEILTPYRTKIEQLEEQLQATNSRANASNEAEKVKRAIVGEDERYDKAYNKYQAARKWVVDQVTDFASQNNVQRALTSGEALDYVFESDDSIKEFNSAFPGLDLTQIVTAEDSKVHFRTAMKHMANAMTDSEDQNPTAKKNDGRFQAVLNKPTGLGQSANAKAGNLSVMDKLNSLTAEDLMNLDDATAAKLEAALAAEEKEGIKF